MNRGHPGSMIDTKLEGHRISASRRCPSCSHELDCKPVCIILHIHAKPSLVIHFLGATTNSRSLLIFISWVRMSCGCRCKKDMVGLPAGVKFDPTDKELIEHLEAKVKEGGSRAHPLIDEFILTIQGENGICYTHPEKLPGVTRDGLSKHFFHRPSKAYTTGTRKRRKIQTECDLPSNQNGGETRWHKTGKTRPVMVDDRQKGCKKILVLYNNFGKRRKPEKTNWVMHQYHLGDLEEEGKLIVSKVFYQTQPRQSASVALDQRARAGDTVAEKQGAMQHGLPGNEVAAAAAVQVQRQQQQRLKQADGQFSSSPPKKRLHEVGVDQVTVYQGGEHHDHHHMPSQRHVIPNLQAKVVPAMCSLTGKPLNPVSTIASPAIRHTSVVLKNQLHTPEMLLRNENFQMNNPKEGLQQQQQELDHRSAGLEELIMACQSTSTKGGTKINPQSQETQWPYQYWPPDNQDQHG